MLPGLRVAMTYPAIAGVSLIVASGFLLLRVVPTLSTVGNNPADLPSHAVPLLWLSGILQDASLQDVFIIASALVFAIRHLSQRNGPGDSFELAAYSRILQRLRVHGSTLVDAMSVAEGVIGSSRLRGELIQARQSVVAGSRLAQSLASAQHHLDRVADLRSGAVGKHHGRFRRMNHQRAQVWVSSTGVVWSLWSKKVLVDLVELGPDVPPRCPWSLRRPVVMIVDPGHEEVERVASAGLGADLVGRWQRALLERDRRRTSLPVWPLTWLSRHGSDIARAGSLIERWPESVRTWLRVALQNGIEFDEIYSAARLLAMRAPGGSVPQLLVFEWAGVTRHVVCADGVACLTRVVAAVDDQHEAVIAALEHVAERWGFHGMRISLPPNSETWTPHAIERLQSLCKADVSVRTTPAQNVRRAEVAQRERQSLFLETEANREQALHLDSDPVPTSRRVQRAVAVDRSVPAGPEEVMHLVATSISSYPTVELHVLEWRSFASPDALEDETWLRDGVMQAREPLWKANLLAESPEASSSRTLVELAGTVVGSAGGAVGAAQTAAEGLLQSLRNDPRVHVCQMLQSPLMQASEGPVPQLEQRTLPWRLRCILVGTGSKR